MEFVTAKTDYEPLVVGKSDFGVCEAPDRDIKITVNIVWNRRLSPMSITAISEYYVKTFCFDGAEAKVSEYSSESGQNNKREGIS